MKKNSITKLFLPLTLSAVLAAPAFAEEADQVVPGEEYAVQQTASGDYANLTVIIEDVSGYDGVTQLWGTDENGSPAVLNITEGTVLLSQDTGLKIMAAELTAGREVIAAYSLNDPMMLIHPPRYGTTAVILKSMEADSFVKVDTFDENFLSSGGELKLNVSGETVITDADGNTLTMEDAKGRFLAVFYKATTFSLPPQTSPERIVVLDSLGELPEPEGEVAAEGNIGMHSLSAEVQAFIGALNENQVLAKDDLIFVKLHEIAQLMDFELIWREETGTIEMNRLPVTFTFTIGDITYTHNRALGYFAEAPFIIDGRTYVEASFLNRIM